MLATTDGQNAAKTLDAEFGPRKAALDEDQKAIAQKQNRLDQGKLSDEDRKKLQKEVDDATIVLNAKIDQADADLDKAQKKTLAELGKKMVAVIVEFATSHGLRDGVRYQHIAGAAALCRERDGYYQRSDRRLRNPAQERGALRRGRAVDRRKRLSHFARRWGRRFRLPTCFFKATAAAGYGGHAGRPEHRHLLGVSRGSIPSAK